MYNFLKISPPAHKSDKIPDLFIDITKHKIDRLILCDRLKKGDDIDSEELFKYAIANCEDPAKGVEDQAEAKRLREKKTEELHEETMHGIVELMNFVMATTGKDISENSTFCLTESDKPDFDDEEDDD